MEEISSKKIEYTSHNYDAINTAVDGQSFLVESKAKWFAELERDLRTKRTLYILVGGTFIFFLFALLFWLFLYRPVVDSPIISSNAFTPSERREIADNNLMEPGKKFVLFEQVSHRGGENIITAQQFEYPETNIPVDQWCYLAVNNEQISRYAVDKFGIYERSEDLYLLKFEDACRFIKSGE